MLPCSVVPPSQRNLPIWVMRKVGRRPRFLLLSRASSTPPTTESEPLALEATERRKMSRSFADNINFFNVPNQYTTTEDRSEILTWLSPLEPRIRHQDLRTRRADNVGEWLLQTDEFQRWCDSSQQVGSEHAILFCCGGPAVGKTYLR